MIDFSNPKKGTELELPELASSRELSGVRFVVQDTFQGGMGICLKLRHVGTNEPFALKVIKPEFLGERTTWARFIEELKWWLVLSECDGVSEAHCIARVNEIPCMCAAWLHHGNLRQFIGRGKPEFVFQTMLRIVRTLEWAFTKHNVIHRDLKPENILLDQDWRAFVSDWGLAKALNSFFEESRWSSDGGAVGSPQLTQAGHMVGTMLYAAPEQILGLPTIDHWADIYSLGCILFEWETGRPPFIGRNQMEVAQQHVQVPPRKLGGLFSKTKLGLEDIIACCLEKNPTKRFQNYDSLAQAMLSVAKRRNFRVDDFYPAERYHRVKPGSDELQKELEQAEYSSRGSGFIELEEARVHFDQAAAEASLGNHAKAASLLAPFYDVKMCRKLRDWTICHSIALNYGLYLVQSHTDPREAVGVFESLLCAEPKTPEFFVNYSLALLRSQAFTKAEAVALQGLVAAPGDRDLLGNVSNALRLQGKLSLALEAAQKRLALGRDVHALEEVGHTLKQMGDKHDEQWPDAVKCYKESLQYFREAKKLNTRYPSALFGLILTLRKLERFGDAMDECSALRDMTTERSHKEACACISADLLNDVGEQSKCLEFCKNWLPALALDIHKDWMQRTQAEVLCDQMIGLEREGKRVVVREAFEFFQKRTENVPKPRADDLLNWARIKDWRGDPSVAFELASQAQNIAPNWWKPLSFKAELLARDGQIDAAKNEALAAAKLAPYRPEPLDRLTAIHKKAEQHKEAEVIRQRANEVATMRKKLSKD